MNLPDACARPQLLDLIGEDKLRTHDLRILLHADTLFCGEHFASLYLFLGRNVVQFNRFNLVYPIGITSYVGIRPIKYLFQLIVVDEKIGHEFLFQICAQFQSSLVVLRILGVELFLGSR